LEEVRIYSNHQSLLGYYVAAHIPIEINVLEQVGACEWSVQIGCHTDDLIVSLPLGTGF